MFVVYCVGRDLCDGLIIHTEESDRVCVCACVRVIVCVCVCLIVYDRSYTVWRPSAELAC